MSVHTRADRWEVRWREAGRNRSRAFDRKRDALAFELDVKRRRQLGPLAATVMQSGQTLGEFVETEWWPRYALPNLAESTRRRNLEVWGHDLLPRLGDYPLREITPLLVEDLRDQLARAGLAPASQRKALLLLSAILKRATVRGLIPANPGRGRAAAEGAADARGPTAAARDGRADPAIMLRPRTRAVPATGAGKRAHRAYSASYGSPIERQRNALIVSMLAYAGLRPIEDHGARWGDLGDRTLLVLATKTGRERHIDLLAPLARDLAEWRLLARRPDDDELS